MNRLMATALIGFILFAGTAWAADTHTEAYVGHGNGQVLNNSDAGNDVQDHAPCDHCCHGAAHYLGLLPAPLTGLQPVTETGRIHHISVYLTRATPPPAQPPRT